MENSSNTIIRLNDWISYDSEKEAFIIEERSITIPSQVLFIDWLSNNNTVQKANLKIFMKKLWNSSNGIKINQSHTAKKMGKWQTTTWNTNANGKKRNIEMMLLKNLWVQKQFEFLDARESRLFIKKNG